jgi:CheY-like chemotaxis protein
VDPDIPDVVTGDRLRIYQVLTNLLSNALKFTAEGRIVLRARVKSSSDECVLVSMEVADTGIGIEAQALGRVFDAFSQADETTTRRFGGAGLGLSICKQLVELMGGHIGVSSQPGTGSTFWFEVPLAVPRAAPQVDTGSALEAVDAADTASTTVGAKRRVLVVEDNVVNQMVAEGIVSHLGYQVRKVADGQAALELLAAEHIDLVLMDCQMPGMDGFDATRRIRAAEQGDEHLPIIGLTAHASAEAREACLKAGMDDFVSKPCTINQLAPVLSRWLAADKDENGGTATRGPQ